MRLIGKRRLAAVAAGAALAGLCIAGSATNASASTPGVLYAANGDQAHQCNVIGSDQYGNQGVVCADLIATINLYNGEPQALAVAEVFCQNSQKIVVQCAETHGYVALANAQTGAGTRVEGDCGHSYLRCSSGRNYWAAGDGFLDTSGNCLTSLLDNYWGVVFGQGALTSIELPMSDKWVYLNSSNANDSGNESSGHDQVCP